VLKRETIEATRISPQSRAKYYCQFGLVASAFVRRGSKGASPFDVVAVFESSRRNNEQSIVSVAMAYTKIGTL